MKLLIIIIPAITVILVVFWIIRVIYLRSVRMRNRLQMDKIFTNITHELLTPLTVVSASVEHLREHAPAYQQDYEMMDMNIQRMVRLLQQILEASKSQSGELKLQVLNGDVMKYIQETARCIIPLMRKSGVDFKIECVPASMMGWIDTDKIDKIIYNLLSNAAKYTQKTDGRIELDVRTNPYFNQLIIRVADNGIGIPKGKMKRLFHRFYDGDYRLLQTSGTGIGLALTRDLVYLHHGTIKCESEEGKGATFTVVIPIGKDAYSKEEIDERNIYSFQIPHGNNNASQSLPTSYLQPETDQNIDEKAPHVLIIEDNQELLVMMSHVLKSHYHVHTATTGKEGIKIIKENTIDIVVSDIMMPGMDGLEMMKILKNDPDYSYLPVILISAKTQEEDRIEAYKAGADDYLMKPFRMGELQLRIDNIISNRQRIHGEVKGNSEEQQEIPRVTHIMTEQELFIKRAKETVLAHLQDSDYDRTQFAADMGASTSTLYNKIRAATGTNISNFIRDIRIKKAIDIMNQEQDIRISDLAYRVGFRDPKYFSTCFKKITGLQPTEYISSNTNPQT